mmetsp:Transcript_7245/g.23186  ORF Transcript_7245/g.23186 Transcript_7245/m.23186 type:complete len:325 (+) Transcript_7245:797-1771(+)
MSSFVLLLHSLFLLFCLLTSTQRAQSPDYLKHPVARIASHRGGTVVGGRHERAQGSNERFQRARALHGGLAQVWHNLAIVHDANHLHAVRGRVVSLQRHHRRVHGPQRRRLVQRKHHGEERRVVSTKEVQQLVVGQSIGDVTKEVPNVQLCRGRRGRVSKREVRHVRARRFHAHHLVRRQRNLAARAQGRPRAVHHFAEQRRSHGHAKRRGNLVEEGQEHRVVERLVFVRRQHSGSSIAQLGAQQGVGGHVVNGMVVGVQLEHRDVAASIVDCPREGDALGGLLCSVDGTLQEGLQRLAAPILVVSAEVHLARRRYIRQEGGVR